MTKLSYQEQAENLSKAIDIAIYSVQTYPSKGLRASDIDDFIKVYTEAKKDALHPKPNFANVKSLKYIIEDVFIYFQESSGPAIEWFWKEIKAKDLPYQRKNKLKAILKRKKIKNKIEYDFVIDVMVPYQSGELITEQEVTALNQYLSDFEEKKKR